MLLLDLLAELAAVLLAMLQSSLLLQRSSSLWNSYCNQLRKRPLLTKAATGMMGRSYHALTSLVAPLTTLDMLLMADGWGGAL